MTVRDNSVAALPWRKSLVCLAMLLLLLGGIRLHALQFTIAPGTSVSTNHQRPGQHPSFDSDGGYCIAPPRVFAFEPAPAVVSRVVASQVVFLPSHPDGWHFNRPPPAL
jgi:hypothetical protein